MHKWRCLSLTLIPWWSMWLVWGGRLSPVTVHAQAPSELGRWHAEGCQHPWGSPPWEPCGASSTHAGACVVPCLLPPVFSVETLPLPSLQKDILREAPTPPCFLCEKKTQYRGRDEVEGEQDPGSHTLMANNLFLILKTFTGRWTLTIHNCIYFCVVQRKLC